MPAEKQNRPWGAGRTVSVSIGLVSGSVFFGKVIQSIFAATDHKLVERHILALRELLKLLHQRKRQTEGLVDELASFEFKH